MFAIAYYAAGLNCWKLHDTLFETYEEAKNYTQRSEYRNVKTKVLVLVGISQ